VVRGYVSYAVLTAEHDNDTSGFVIYGQFLPFSLEGISSMKVVIGCIESHVMRG
jgi:hypothetical protein